MIYGDFGDEWIHEPESRVADHDPYGVLAIDGPEIEVGVEVEADLKDMAPTLLFTQGSPILDDFDGRVLTDLFSEEFLENATGEVVPADRFEVGSSGDRREKDGVEQRLEDLGYL
jgi:hypothetical protein